MKKILLDSRKPFYKANLHCHSTYSDGKLTVNQLKEAYKAQGYSVLAITDHEHIIDNSELNDSEFLTITSCEIAIKEFATVSTSKNLDMKVAHLNFYALDPHNTLTPCYSSVYDRYANIESLRGKIKFDGEYQREYTPESINEIIRIANESGFLVSYNHPSWSLENSTDFLNYKDFFAVEIYNHSTVVLGGKSDEYALDDFWKAGTPVFCTACDDAHAAHPIGSTHNDMFGGWVQINSPALTYDNIITSLKNGDFYASCGPEIYSLCIEDSKVKIEFSDCVKASYITRGRRRSSVIAKEGETVNCAEFTLKETDGYFRIKLTDKSGKEAYTQFYKLG